MKNPQQKGGAVSPYQKKIQKIKKAHDAYFVICSPVRFNIINVLLDQGGPLTVGNLAKALGWSLSRVSHQLALLEKHRIIGIKRRGREKFCNVTKLGIKKSAACMRLCE